MTIWGSGGLGTIACAEEAGSASETYEDEFGFMSASVTLRCAYADRHALVADICGNRLPWRKGAAGVVPKAYSASIVPVVTPGVYSGDEVLDYGEALVTVNYSTKVVELFSESIEPYAEFLTLDHRFFRWAPYTGPIGITGTGSTGTAIFPNPQPLREEEAPGRLMRGINYVRTDLNVLPPLQNTLVDYVGYVNSDIVTWSLLGFTSGPETLMYSPPQINWKRDSTNQLKFDITKKFTYNPQGWNTFFRGATGRYQPIYVAGTDVPYKSYPPVPFVGGLL